MTFAFVLATIGVLTLMRGLLRLSFFEAVIPMRIGYRLSTFDAGPCRPPTAMPLSKACRADTGMATESANPVIFPILSATADFD
jgi:hypothetical protein